MSAFRRPLATALACRATVCLVLSGGLLRAAGSDAPAVVTIAATVILVAIVLSGVATTWLGSVARRTGVSGAGWLTAQGALVLLVGLVAPVLLIANPLIETATVLWIYAGTFFVAGILEIIAGVSRAAGITAVAASGILAGVLWLRPATGLAAVLGPAGVVIGAAGLALAWWAVRAAASS